MERSDISAFSYNRVRKVKEMLTTMTHEIHSKTHSSFMLLPMHDHMLECLLVYHFLLLAFHCHYFISLLLTKHRLVSNVAAAQVILNLRSYLFWQSSTRGSFESTRHSTSFTLSSNQSITAASLHRL